MIRLPHSLLLLLLGMLYGALALPSHLDSLDRHLAGRNAQTDLAARAPAEPAPDTPHLIRLKYNKIKPLPETIPANATGELYRKYQPYFYIDGGCSPYVAIDGDARLNKGLDPDADGSDKEICRQSKGQVYVRSGQYKKYFAIMYSWYMPRDACWTEKVSDGAGHRHDWENVVIWLNKKQTKVIAVAPSAHGGYKTYAKVDFNFKGKTHALVGYGQPYEKIRNHQLLKADEDEVGSLQAMVAWESMTDAMRLAIETPGSFDGTTPGFRDSEWDRFMKIAYPSLDLLD